MKILLLTQYFPPEFGAAAARNSEHPRFWAEAGHEVEVLTGFPNYPEGVIPESYRGMRFAREQCDGYQVLRTWIYATPNRGLFRRALASLSFLVSAALTGAFRCARPDVVVASSGPFFVGPLGWLLSRAKRARFVMEVRDILPQQAVDTGMLRNPGLIWLLFAIERFLYRQADAVVCVAEASRQALVARGFDAQKIHTIENGIREDFFAPGERNNPLCAELGWAERFVALYVGVHGVSQGLFALLDAAERLRGEPDILFVFAGEGAEKPALMAEAEKRGLDNVRFLPVQDKARMPLLYAAADACFVPLRQGDYFTINIPSKIFEIMACARPIMLGALGQARKIVEEAGAGLAVQPEDARGYAQAVLELRGDPALRARLGESGRAHVLAHFTRRGQAQKYLTLLERLR